MSGWRNVHPLVVTGGLRKVAFEFAAVVDMPGQLAHRIAVVIHVPLDMGRPDGAGSHAAFFRKRPER